MHAGSCRGSVIHGTLDMDYRIFNVCTWSLRIHTASLGWAHWHQMQFHDYIFYMNVPSFFQEKRSRETQKRKYKKKENKAFSPSQTGCCLEDFIPSSANPLVPLFVEKCILFIESEGNLTIILRDYTFWGTNSKYWLCLWMLKNMEDSCGQFVVD